MRRIGAANVYGCPRCGGWGWFIKRNGRGHTHLGAKLKRSYKHSRVFEQGKNWKNVSIKYAFIKLFQPAAKERPPTTHHHHRWCGGEGAECHRVVLALAHGARNCLSNYVPFVVLLLALLLRARGAVVLYLHAYEPAHAMERPPMDGGWVLLWQYVEQDDNVFGNRPPSRAGAS